MSELGEFAANAVRQLGLRWSCIAENTATSLIIGIGIGIWAHQKVSFVAGVIHFPLLDQSPQSRMDLVTQVFTTTVISTFVRTAIDFQAMNQGRPILLYWIQNRIHVSDLTPLLQSKRKEMIRTTCWATLYRFIYLARMRQSTSCKDMECAKGTGLTTHPEERPTWEMRVPRGVVKSWRLQRSAINSKCVELAIITMMPGQT